MTINRKKRFTPTAESEDATRSTSLGSFSKTASTTSDHGKATEDKQSYVALTDENGYDDLPVADTGTPANAIRRIRKRGHSRPLLLTLDLNRPGRLRVGHVLNLFSISHAALYQRMRDGRFPKPDGSDGRPFWNTSTIRAELEK